MTSRVSPDRIPVGYARALADLPFKVKILGSGQDGGHRDELRRAMSAGRHLDFVDPDLPEGLSERRKNEEMLKSSVMLHYTPSGMRDVLEYSILDALATGTVPVCISDDRHQLGTLTRHGIGPMVRRPADLPAAVEAAIENHDIYRSKGRDFLATFLDDQHGLRQRWSDSTEKVLSTL